MARRQSSGKTVYVDGLEELLAQLDGLKNVEELMGPGRQKAAEITQAAIKEEAAPHRRTGKLDQSIQINPDALNKRPKNITFVAVNHSVAPHAHLVEFGARGGQMPADPFFSRGYQKSRSAALDALMADAKAAVDKAL